MGRAAVGGCATYLPLVTSTGATRARGSWRRSRSSTRCTSRPGARSSSQSQCHTVGQNPQAQLGRSPSIAGSSFVDKVPSDAGIQAIVGGITQRIQSGQPGAIAFDAYGGAINRVATDATAFVHRNSLCSAQYSVSYNTTDSPATVSAHQAWLAQYGRALQPYVSSAAYQNYIDPTLANSLDAYYGSTCRRQDVKKKWDPDDEFRFRQSIPLP